jgi:hypothetical protein
VKIEAIRANNHKKAFEVSLPGGLLTFPYSQSDPAPEPSDPVVSVYVDEELGCEGFTYVLRSGSEGSVHVDWVLEYNEDPKYMRDLLLYNLTVEALKRIKAGRVPKNEILRRVGTSASQLARLLDTTNKTKSLDKMVELLRALDCEVEFTVRPTRGAGGRRSKEPSGAIRAGA